MPSGQVYCSSCIRQRWSRCECGALYCCSGGCAECCVRLERCAACCERPRLCASCQGSSDEEPWLLVAGGGLTDRPRPGGPPASATDPRTWAASAADIAAGAASAVASSAAELAALGASLYQNREVPPADKMVAFLVALRQT
ncbi:MAG TPA: hypothetical protein VNI01_02310 [Elusimicrobiota bacterium]|nr:hypothetical protein [Elusimicrobiota bacterium]